MSEEVILQTGYGSLVLQLIKEVAVPLATLLTVYLVGVLAFKFVASLYVTSDANEWVVILNNGKMKAAGVGLNCFRGPFDQVAKFPAQVNKVTFKTEQVTKEMQGI